MRPRLRLSTKYGINTAIVILFAIGIVIFAEALSYRHNWKKDFTGNMRHSLSGQSINILKELKEPVKVTAFVTKASPSYEQAKELFGLYTDQSNMVEMKLVDPDLNPDLAREAEIRRYGVPVVFFETGEGRETVTELTEEHVTNALIKVTRGEKKRIYFVTGHGEHSLDDVEAEGLSIAKKMMEDKNYQVETLVLMRAEAAPADCDILAVAGPQNDLSEPEIKAIESYIRNGGRALFFVDPQTAPSLTPLLKQYGITLGDDIVLDRLSRLFGGDYLTPVLTSYSASHAITRNFNVASSFSVARSVSPEESTEAQATWLAKTGEGSWAETDLAALEKGTASLDPEKDTPGPISLAAVSELNSSGEPQSDAPEAKRGALVVFGDSDFIINSRIQFSGNSDLFMNSVNWLGREENLIAIPPKETKFQPVMLTPGDAKILFILPVIVLPGLVLMGGIYVFVRRSRHS